MEFWSVWVIFVFVFMAAAIVWAVWSHNKFKKRWLNWTRARDWLFLEKWPEMVGAFRGGPFGRGSSRTAFFGYEGRFDGVPAAGFNYRYTTGSGKNSTTHHYHVDLIRLNGSFPRLSLSRENWGTRTFGSDIEFEDAAFNHQWRIKCDSRRFAHDVVHPRMMEWLKGEEVPVMEEVWFENGCLLVSTRGSRTPEQVDHYLRFLTRFASQLPRFVLDEVGCGRLPITWDGPGVSPEEQARRIAQLAAQEDQG